MHHLSNRVFRRATHLASHAAHVVRSWKASATIEGGWALLGRSFLCAFCALLLGYLNLVGSESGGSEERTQCCLIE